jgi:hypothetical protein
MRSMAKVVASNNLKAAAENEGQALLITKQKLLKQKVTQLKLLHWQKEKRRNFAGKVLHCLEKR